MAQKRIDYSKFTRSNGTVLVLAIWASLTLHLLTASNLDKIGLVNPVKAKPVGGTVRVVDLTPAEQTRVPEAAKSRPLPISKIPVNPEIATRSPSPPGNSGVSALLPPRNRPQLPLPSTQVPPNQPVVSTNSNSKKPKLSDNLRKKRSSQEDGSEEDDKEKSGGNTGSRKKVKAEVDKDDISQLGDKESEGNKMNGEGRERNEKKREKKETRNIKKKTENKENLLIDTEEKDLKTVLETFKQKGITLVSLEVPKKFFQISSCEKYKKIRVFWPIDKNGELEDVTPIFIPKNNSLNENHTDPAKEIVEKTYNELSLTRKKTLANKFADYSFQIPFGRCNT